METYNLTEYHNGWFIGNFSPSIIKTEKMELAIKRYTQWQRESKHVHKEADEITVIVEGTVLMNGQILGKNTIIYLKAGEAADFFALTEAITCVMKTPSVIGDKHPVPE